MPETRWTMSNLAHFEHDRDRVSELSCATLDRNLTDRFAFRGHYPDGHRPRRRCRLATLGDHHRAAECASGSLREQTCLCAGVIERSLQTLIAAASWIRHFEVETGRFVHTRIERDLQQPSRNGNVLFRHHNLIR